MPIFNNIKTSRLKRFKKNINRTPTNNIPNRIPLATTTRFGLRRKQCRLQPTQPRI